MHRFPYSACLVLAVSICNLQAADPGLSIPDHTQAVPSAASAEDVRLLERVQASSMSVYDALQSFICNERIERFRSAVDGTRERPIDTIRAALSFENGSEHYTSILQNERVRSDISSVPGAWSEGEFGSLLKQTQELLRVEHVSYLRDIQFEGEALAVYSFDTPAQDSPWDLAVESHTYSLPFHTEVYISRATERIVSISRSAMNVPSDVGISGIEWAVFLKPVAMNGSEWWLPASATYSVAYAGKNRRESNRIVFDDYHRYGATAELRFDKPSN